jgi:hypothetical protein
VRERRMPKVGDLIIYKASSVPQHAGLVTEIHLDKYGHQRNVLIEWSTRPPPDYNEGWGYAGVNIHNQRSIFDVIRNGVEIK